MILKTDFAKFLKDIRPTSAMRDDLKKGHKTLRERLNADDGVDGIVVRLDQPTFRESQYNPTGEISLLRAMAGADMARTMMDATRRGLVGLSQMAGIPATIGGAILGYLVGATVGRELDQLDQ